MPKPSSTTLWILALVMVINALSYGIIIPLMYPLAERLQLGPAGLGVLMASFSLAQFFATPIIGRLSDRYGRKPLLLLSVLGSSASMALLAVADHKGVFFVARVLDGVTGGNNSVAQAAIADSTPVDKRPAAFGMLGAAYGFGFLVGPSIGGLLGQWGLSVPFWFAAGLALVAVGLGVVFMQETLAEKNSQAVKIESLFHWRELAASVRLPMVGGVLSISLLVSLAQSGFIIGVQSVGYEVLHLTTAQFGLMLGGVGLANIAMQAGVIRWLNQHVPKKAWILTGSLVASMVCLTSLFFHLTPLTFTVLNMLYAIALTPVNPVVTGLLSSHIHSEDQGLALGLNQAYISLGTIVGPLLGGYVVTHHPRYTFLATAIVLGIALWQVWRLPARAKVVNL